MPTPLGEAYDFLTRAFSAHQLENLQEGVKDYGRVVSKKEGAKLGLDADTFTHFYDNVRQPGRSVSRTKLLEHAAKHFDTQMAELRESLGQGPGVTGFALARDVVDNWQAFIGKENLFKLADLPTQHREAVITNAYWDFDKIPVAPDKSAVVRDEVGKREDLLLPVQRYIEAVEGKVWVNADPAVTPPTDNTLKRLKFDKAFATRVDGVLVGYQVFFQPNERVVLNPDGTPITKGLDLYEVDPDVTVSFAELSTTRKVDALRGGEFDGDDSRPWDDMSPVDILKALGTNMTRDECMAALADGYDYVAGQLELDLEYLDIPLGEYGIDLTAEYLRRFDSYGDFVDHLAEKAEATGNFTADEIYEALGNGGTDVGGPSVEVFKEGNTLIGAKLNFSVCVDGDHDYWTELYYDATTDKIVGGSTGGYETDTDVWVA